MELSSVAVNAAKKASKEILNHYKNFEIYTKEDKSPLTTADLAANEAIMSELGKTGIKICSEESILKDDERVKQEQFWLVDPLDGTKEFIAKNGEFCVCIALIKSGRPVLSVIAIPCSCEIFYSSGGGVVYKDGEILKPKDKTPNFFLMGKHGSSKKREEFANKFGFDIKRVGSAIKFCHIAKNSAATYARLGPSSLWDIAAGDFLVEQSGGVTIDLSTLQKPLYNRPTLLNNPYLVVDKNHIKNLDEYLKFLKK